MVIDQLRGGPAFATKEQRDAINQQRRSEGKKEISPEDFTTGKF